MVTAAISPISLVGSVRDPEIPALEIGDLGIVRSVKVDGSRVSVTLIPTYSGCPAMDAIRSDIAAALAEHGYECNITTAYTPAWTTDMITARGRQVLIETGIAPPTEFIDASCPQCGTPAPNLVSEFGSTACKALMVCSSCREPFDLFKEHR
jgi:ring-1,2-phenylacetyl-CoA epoxidase subunit PaaD